MYKVITIGEGDLDRFILLVDDIGNEIEVFDYSGSTVGDLAEAFHFEVNKLYQMKLQLFGNIEFEPNNRGYGKLIEIRIIEKCCLGRVEMFVVLSKLGEFLINIDKNSSKLYESESKIGYFRYSRIDILEVDNKIHPEFK